MVMRHPWVTAKGTDPLPITLYASVLGNGIDETESVCGGVPFIQGAEPDITQLGLRVHEDGLFTKHTSPQPALRRPVAQVLSSDLGEEMDADAIATRTFDTSPPPQCGITLSVLGKISHDRSAARILAGCTEDTPTLEEHPALDERNGYVYDATSSPDASSMALELSFVLSDLALWENKPLPPECALLLAPAVRSIQSSLPDCGSPLLSPQSGTTTPRVWWPSFPGTIGVPTDTSVLTLTGGTSYLRAGGSSPSAAMDEFPSLSIRVAHKLLLAVAADTALNEGIASAAAEALFDDWTRPPEEGPAVNFPPAYLPLTPRGVHTIEDPELDKYLLHGTDTLESTRPIPQRPPSGASSSSGISLTPGCIETIGPEGLDAELGGLQPEVSALLNSRLCRLSERVNRHETTLQVCAATPVLI